MPFALDGITTSYRLSAVGFVAFYDTNKLKWKQHSELIHQRLKQQKKPLSSSAEKTCPNIANQPSIYEYNSIPFSFFFSIKIVQYPAQTIVFFFLT